jgi:hypothetical protein
VPRGRGWAAATSVADRTSSRSVTRGGLASRGPAGHHRLVKIVALVVVVVFVLVLIGRASRGKGSSRATGTTDGGVSGGTVWTGDGGAGPTHGHGHGHHSGGSDGGAGSEGGSGGSDSGGGGGGGSDGGA